MLRFQKSYLNLKSLINPAILPPIKAMIRIIFNGVGIYEIINDINIPSVITPPVINHTNSGILLNIFTSKVYNYEHHKTTKI
jgi:hypothetical protein